MEIQEIENSMQNYVANREMSGGALMVRKNKELVYQNKWGKGDIEGNVSISYDSIYRMMSLSKVVTAVGILKMMEQGKIGLDDELSKYIPEFSDMRVSCDERYRVDSDDYKKLYAQLPLFQMEEVKSVPAERKITIRDLLSHSSGLEQGSVGLCALLKMKNEDETLEQRVNRYAGYVLDFQPGMGTGYSPMASFDILGRVTEIVSGMRLEEYLQKEIAQPLEMTSTTYFLNDEQKSRLVRVYKRQDESLTDVTGTKEDMWGILRQDEAKFEQGCGGLFSTITDMEHLAEMLCNQGMYHGQQFLEARTVELMHTEAPKQHLEPEPGMVWGLGVRIRQNPKAADSYATEGTYGWSGAFGTHLVVSPKDNLEAVFMTKRTDLNGSGSYISREVERLVFGIWGSR
ncbi:beta-lactamase family protein [Faecalicatena sp. AGMB00832]|uniref:Beta-lactamase family protein n=1 Tax=Faecalicatena faecalis TaxID=2726362 RepID=A0ABS6D091_9FIRM|nr:serine hydrolase domain-containing protein [Faecalicatena faecalis]MBU3874921.1 beta-lactamase family protein [Faecalicatena faecalis]